MLPYCLKCRKNTESKSRKVLKAKNRKNGAFIQMCSVCHMCRFIKEQKPVVFLKT